MPREQQERITRQFLHATASGDVQRLLSLLSEDASNYTNGFTVSLLGHSAYCLKGVNVDKSHGIVSGCE